MSELIGIELIMATLIHHKHKPIHWLCHYCTKRSSSKRKLKNSMIIIVRQAKKTHWSSFWGSRKLLEKVKRLANQGQQCHWWLSSALQMSLLWSSHCSFWNREGRSTHAGRTCCSRSRWLGWWQRMPMPGWKPTRELLGMKSGNVIKSQCESVQNFIPIIYTLLLKFPKESSNYLVINHINNHQREEAENKTGKYEDHCLGQLHVVLSAWIWMTWGSAGFLNSSTIIKTTDGDSLIA